VWATTLFKIAYRFNSIVNSTLISLNSIVTSVSLRLAKEFESDCRKLIGLG
jgi:hypothetical protein